MKIIIHNKKYDDEITYEIEELDHKKEQKYLMIFIQEVGKIQIVGARWLGENNNI